MARLLGFAIIFTFSLNLLAQKYPCDKVYEEKASFISGTESIYGVAAGLGILGFLANPIPGFAGTAIVGGASASASSGLAIVLIAGGVVVGGGVLVYDGVKYFTRSGLRRALNLFTQADAGDGLELRTFRAKLASMTNTKLELNELISMINLGRSGSFCATEILSVEEIQTLLGHQLLDL